MFRNRETFVLKRKRHAQRIEEAAEQVEQDKAGEGLRNGIDGGKQFKNDGIQIHIQINNDDLEQQDGQEDRDDVLDPLLHELGDRIVILEQIQLCDQMEDDGHIQTDADRNHDTGGSCGLE